MSVVRLHFVSYANSCYILSIALFVMCRLCVKPLLRKGPAYKCLCRYVSILILNGGLSVSGGGGVGL